MFLPSEVWTLLPANVGFDGKEYLSLMASFMEVEMVVVRHGETEANRSHTIQGHRDTALSDLGVKQAEYAAKYLGENLIWVLCWTVEFDQILKKQMQILNTE